MDVKKGDKIKIKVKWGVYAPATVTDVKTKVKRETYVYYESDDGNIVGHKSLDNALKRRDIIINENTMKNKDTENKLKKIIREELTKSLREADDRIMDEISIKMIKQGDANGELHAMVTFHSTLSGGGGSMGNQSKTVPFKKLQSALEDIQKYALARIKKVQ